MEEHRTGCLVCGKEIEYLPQPREIACSVCGGVHRTEAACTEGHYVCDRCHRLPAFDVITAFCRNSESRNPVTIAMALMRHPSVKMHGPEHHFLVPAVLLTAWSNARGEHDLLDGWLEKARQRSEWVKGGFCGLLGDCGAAVGTGIFVSVVLGATPLSGMEWRLANRMTARSLSVIAEHGGAPVLQAKHVPGPPGSRGLCQGRARHGHGAARGDPVHILAPEPGVQERGVPVPLLKGIIRAPAITPAGKGGNMSPIPHGSDRESG